MRFFYVRAWFKIPEALISLRDVSFLQAPPPPRVTSRNAQAGLSGWGNCWKRVASWSHLSSACRASRWAELMKLGFRGSRRDCEYSEYKDRKDWAKYVAELAFQAFLLKMPNRGCCYISKPLESTVAPHHVLGYQSGQWTWNSKYAGSLTCDNPSFVTRGRAHGKCLQLSQFNQGSCSLVSTMPSKLQRGCSGDPTPLSVCSLFWRPLPVVSPEQSFSLK